MKRVNLDQNLNYRKS